MAEYQGQQIYLVGANRLYNELLAHIITEKTGAECVIAPALSSMPPAAGINVQKRLVLYDFSNNDSLDELLSSDIHDVLRSDYLVLTNVSSSLQIECEALKCGVRGFLYYQGGVDVLLEMIQSVLNSEIWISRELMTRLLVQGGFSAQSKLKEHEAVLSPRELDILSGLSMGLTNKMIADYYCLSTHTVKTHIYRIFKKIRVTNRVQATQWVSQHPDMNLTLQQKSDTKRAVPPPVVN